MVEGAGRRLRPGRTFIKELFCGSLMLTWMAATTLGLAVSQPDDVKDGFGYLHQGQQREIVPGHGPGWQWRPWGDDDAVYDRLMQRHEAFWRQASARRMLSREGV